MLIETLRALRKKPAEIKLGEGPAKTPLYIRLEQALPWQMHFEKSGVAISPLRKSVSFKGRFKKGEKPELFREFIYLKEGQGLDGLFPGAIKISPLNETRSLTRAVFRLPTRIPLGIHRVCLTVIQNGQVKEHRCIPFEVVMAGLPAFLTFLASRRVIFCDIFSVSIAVAAGFLSGTHFKKRRGEKSNKEDPCKGAEGKEESTPLDSEE